MKRHGFFYLMVLIVLPALSQAEAPKFDVGPFLRFTAPDKAVVCWQSVEPSRAQVTLEREDGVQSTVEDNESIREHRVTLAGLEHGTKYACHVVLQQGEETTKSVPIEVDTSLNYCVVPIPDRPSPFGIGEPAERIAKAAEEILTRSGVRKGYAIVYGSGSGQLAYELARRSDLEILGVDVDESRIDAARRQLMQAGAYGTRVTLRLVQSLGKLPCTSRFANLVVSESIPAGGLEPANAMELSRVLRPSGGVLMLGPMPDENRSAREWATWLGDVAKQPDVSLREAGAWVILTRGALPGAGSWTHQYGNPDNSANGGDTLLGASRTDQMEVQWIGRPGADFGIDRNPRMPAPLACNGRLYHQGLNRLASIDAYNGSILWTMEIPTLRRVNIPRDAGNWCADDQRVYLAIESQCWGVNGNEGELEKVYRLPDSAMRATHDWGYLARRGDRLLGSAVKKGSIYTEYFGHESWYDQTSGYGTGKVCSDNLFSMKNDSGDLVWEYRRGMIINPTITIGGGRVFFIESRAPALASLHTGRIESPDLWQNQFLVALDEQTGAPLWEQAIDTADGVVVFFLIYTDESLVLESSAENIYHLYQFSAKDGKPGWEVEHRWPNNNHGGHMQHAAVTSDVVFLEPYGYALKTGDRVVENMGKHEGCATYAAVQGALIYRGDDRRVSLWDLKTGQVTSWMNLRPSCWLSVIPAGGMVLAPEGGGGCSCGNWIETSLGFAPVASAR